MSVNKKLRIKMAIGCLDLKMYFHKVDQGRVINKSRKHGPIT